MFKKLLPWYSVQKIEKNDELDNLFEMCALFVSSRMKKKEKQASF